MASRIRITSGDIVVEGTLSDSETATSIGNLLPLEGKARTWGNEIYFPIPLEAGNENGRETVEMGDIGYWPPGKALCLFFGATPMSAPGEIRPAGPVTVVGRMEGDLSILKKIAEGDDVKVEALD
ncbi:MAG: cyclophilin-like fold protein [Thermovirgaceae bacterium]